MSEASAKLISKIVKLTTNGDKAFVQLPILSQENLANVSTEIKSLLGQLLDHTELVVALLFVWRCALKTENVLKLSMENVNFLAEFGVLIAKVL